MKVEGENIMLVLLALVLSVVQVTPEDEARPPQVSPCQLVLRSVEFDGKLVSVRARVIAGPHDEYIVAKACSPEAARAKYILVQYDPKSAQLRSFARAMLRQSRKATIEVTATLIGKVTSASYPKFGFVSAEVKLEVLEALDLEVVNRK